MTNEIRPFYNVGPGEIIQDGLDALGWTQDDLSDLTGLTPKSVNLIIQNKQSISIDTAQLLARVFQTSPEMWLNLDAAYQIRKHQEGPRELLTEKKSRLRRYMPLAEMRKKGWFLYDDTLEGLTRECNRLFGGNDIPEDEFQNSASFCARRSKEDEEYTAWYSHAWYQVAKLRAEEVELPQYDAEALRKLADQMTAYTLSEKGIGEFLNALQACGVGFFVLSHLQKTYLDGAAFLHNRNPFVVYTARHNRTDNFWYTLAHEIAHVLLHLETDSLPILDNLDNSGVSDIEKEADSLAAQFLHISEVIEEGQKVGKYLSAERLSAMSNVLNISIPVALGILQHYKIVEWRQFSKYKIPVLQSIPVEYIKG